MADLSSESVRAYWRHTSPELADFFELIEKAEWWTLDDADPEIERRIVRFGETLERASADRLEELGGDGFLFLLAYMSASRSIRLITSLDERHDGLGTRLLARLLERDDNGVFRNISDRSLATMLVQRVRAVQNRTYFQELVNPDRLDELARAIEHYSEGSRA